MNTSGHTRIATLVIGVIVVGIALQTAYAVTTRNLRTQLQSVRYRVTTADVLAGTGEDQTIKRITLFTLAGGDQVLSFVSKVTTPFTLPNGAEVVIAGIRPYRNGVELSECDLGKRPDISQVNFEHAKGPCDEHIFYDEDLATDIVVTFKASDSVSNISALNPGSVDFIVTKVQ